MGGQHEVIVPRVDGDVAHRHGREVAALELGPVRAGVHRDEQAKLRAQIEDARPLQVLLDHMRVAAHPRGRADEGGPGLAEIRRAIQVRREIAEGVPVEGGVGRPLGMAAGLHPRHPGGGRQALHVLDQVGPGPAVVLGQLEVAVVGPGPDHARLHRAFGDGVDGRVHLGGGVVDGDPAGLLLLLFFRVVGGQVRGQPVPGLAVVAGAVQILGSEIERGLVVRAQRHGRVPVEPQLLEPVRLGLDVPLLQGVAVHPGDGAALRLPVQVVFRVRRVGIDEEAVATHERLPAAVGDPARIGAVADPVGVVLQAAIDLVGVLHVEADMVELRHGQIVVAMPAVAAVGAVPQAAVVAGDDVGGVARVHPDLVVVPVHAAGDGGEALAPVLAGDELQIALEHPVGVLRIHGEVGEVEGPPHHELAAVPLAPGLAAVVGAEQGGAAAFDDGVDDVGIGRRHGDPDPAQRPGREARVGGGILLCPGLAAVGGDVEAAAGRLVRPLAAGTEGPALAPEVPQGREHLVGVLRVDGQGGAARGQVRALQDLRPGLAAVGGLVQAAVGGIAPQPSSDAGIDRVGIARVDHDPCDPLRIGQAHIGPGVAAVGGLVDAVADGDRVAGPGLPRADPVGVGMAGVEGDRPDGLHRRLVEHRREGGAAVPGLPHAARGRADEQGGPAVRLRPSGDGGDPPGHGGGADVAGAEARYAGRGELHLRGAGGAQRGPAGGGGEGEGEGETRAVTGHDGGPSHLPAAGLTAGWTNWVSSTAVFTSILLRVRRWRWFEPRGPLSDSKGK